MNPHATAPLGLIAAGRSVFAYRRLLRDMIWREVVGRYRGSVLGLLWSFFTPLMMLAVYTFVFSVVFNARWAGGTGSKVEFAVVLFVGLMVFNVFSEVAGRAPTLILSNPNYVKKVVFPLEILSVVSLGAAAFHLAVSVVVWLLFYLLAFGVPSPTALQFPILLVPLAFLCLGVSWILASLGVYLRDVSQVVGIIITVLMFMSPIFYPIAALPEEFRGYMHLSPLTYFVEQSRDLLIWGKPLDWSHWVVSLGVSLLVAAAGFAWFQKTRKGFADVL